MKKKLRNELRENIQLRADLRKAEVEIDKLQQSNSLLNAEIEEAQQNAGHVCQCTHKDVAVNMEVDPNSIMQDAHMDHNGGVVDIGGGETGISINIEFNACGQVNEMDAVAVGEINTPAQVVSGIPPFADHEPSWTLMSQPSMKEKGSGPFKISR